MSAEGSGDLVIVFADKGDDPARRAAFFEAVNALAERHAFRPSLWGSRQSVRKELTEEQARLDAADTAAMLAELARRDADEYDEAALQSAPDDASL